MERRRGTTVAVVAALIIAVVSLGIAFAAFSSTLTINGSATVQASNWKIYFTDSSTGTDPGTSGKSLPSNQIVTSNLQSGIASTASGSATVKTANFTWSATFKTPGDKVVYDFYVRNTGSFAAKITDINTPTISCTTGTAPGTEETTVCGHIHYELRKGTADGSLVALNDEITSGGNAHYYVVAWMDNTNWSPTGSDLPTTDVNVSTTQISITYTQK